MVLSAAMFFNGGVAWAQTAPPPQAPRPQTPPAQTSPSQAVPAGQTAQPAQTATQENLDHIRLDRIRQGLAQDSTLRLDNGQLKIYVEVVAPWPTFYEKTRGYDFLNGPTGGGNPMSHQEFLGMVTPKEMYGSGGISAPEVLAMAVVNYFGQKALLKGAKELQQMKQSRDQKKIAEIRARIDAEIAGLSLRGGL